MAFNTTPTFARRHPKTAFTRRSARGNVFAMLFAAVTLTGVLASVGMQTLTGPVTTITRVTQKNIADNNLLMNVKILVAAAVSGTGGGDPDNDGMIEPAEYIAPGGGEAAPTGGGFLPTTLGLVLTDPWGTRYGYCVWDHGTSNSSSRRLTGDNTETASTQPVIAIIAAGPDKIFQTSCAAYTGGTVSVAKQGGADDLVFRYTYAEATASSNGLWTLSPTDQAKAELKDSTGIANVSIDRATGIGRFYGIVTDTLAATTDMLTVDGALKLDDQTGVITCGAAEAGVVRYNAASSKLEVCNGSAWKPAGSSEATYVTRTPSDDLESEQALSLLPSGILKVTTGTGTIVSGAVDLGGAEASGILAAGRFPALTGEVTTTEGSLATSVADDVLDFSELTDAMTLDASTDIAVTGSNVLSVTNTGTGNSLVINDEGGDTTPFVIDADGKVGIGTATLGQNRLTVSTSGNASVLTVGTTFGTFMSQAGTTTGILQADAGGKVYVGASSNHPVGLLAGTTERISILADGNVGIGTFTPSARLEIAGGVKIAGHAACAAGGTNNGTLRFETTLKKMQLCIDGLWANVSSIEKLDDIGDIYLSESGNTEPGNNEVLAWNAENDRWEARNINTVGNAIAAPGGSDKQIQFNDGGTLAGAAQLFWDKTNNRLGLGTSTPGSKLTLYNGDLEFAGGAMPRRLGYATSNAVEQFTYDGDLLGHYALNWYNDSTLGGLSLGISDFFGINFLTSGASRMVITSSGNLGIGTTTPRARLDIVGGARLGTDAVCSAPKAGMLAWNTNVLQLCTDTGAFVPLASSAGPALPSADTLDFSEFKDAMTLDASTDIALTGSNVLSITNTGTGDTLVVNDEAADATPFVISAAGNVGIGTATPTQKLTVSGATDGQIRVVNTATGSSELKLYDTTDGGWSLFSQDGVFRIGKLGTTGSWLSNHIALDATGSLSIGTSAADASALLDVASTSKGFLPPRMTSAQVSAIAAPTNGLLVYDTDIGRYRAYQGGSWQQILTSASGNIADDQLDFDKFRDAMTLDASTDIAATGANVLSITNTGSGNSFVVNDQASDTTPFVVDANGNVGIGTTTPSERLEVTGGNAKFNGTIAVGGTAIASNILVQVGANASDPTTYQVAVSGSRGLTLTANNTNQVTGGSFTANIGGNAFNATGILRGVQGQASHGGTGTGSDLRGVEGLVYNQAAGTVTSASGLYSSVQNLVAGGAVSTFKAVNVGTGFNYGTITNWYGLYVDTPPTATSTWGVYVNGATPSYFGGTVGIGTASPASKVDIAGGARVGADAACSAAKAGMLVWNSNTLQVCTDAGTFTSIATSSGLSGASSALSSITAATANNSIANNANLQAWNWALTGATADAFTFGESTAATGGTAGDQSIVKVSTLASSTATPLIITNLGNGPSFRINDETGDADVSPFVVDASGNVGIGTSTPGTRLDIFAPGSGDAILRLRNSTTDLRLTASSAASTISNNTGPLTFAPGGAEGMRIAPTGNVGIGTSSPASLLHLARPTGSTVLQLDRAAAQFGYLNFTTAGSRRWHVGVSNSAETGANAGSDFYINRAGDDGAYLDTPLFIERSTGNVGIGRVSPPSLLSVASTGYAQFLRDAAGAPLAADCDAAAEFGRIVIDSTNDRWYVCEGAAGWKYVSIGATGGSGAAPLSAITAATAANTIANATNPQVWNWALTGATADAFTFGESTAATGGTAGDQSILKVSTLASSTATPLIITNLGNGPSFKVNDETGDTDATPFVVDATGNVGIGTTSPAVKLAVSGGSVRVTNDTAAPIVHIQAPDVSMGAPALILQAQRAAVAPLQTGDWLGYVDWRNTAYSASARILGVASENQSDTAAGGTLRFQTTENGTTILTDRLTILHNGRVGIGTNTPAAALHVKGADTFFEYGTNGFLRTTADASAVYLQPAPPNPTLGTFRDLRIGPWMSNTSYLTVKDGGNVGIGTTAPASLLSVAATGYAQFLRDSAGAPPAGDCDAAAEFGRIVIDATNDRWYVCEGAAGWKYVSIGTTGGAGAAPLSAISAATATNTITNATNAQIWNWALTGATADAFTLGESTAATGGTAGDQSILKVSTLASSTATPLIVTNLGNGPSFKVNDETGDTDATPFVVDATGNVGIGTANPTEMLSIGTGHNFHNGGNIVHFFNGYYDAVDARHETAGYVGSGFVGGLIFDPVSGRFSFATSSAAGAANTAAPLSTHFSVTSAGNVGIGTTTPAGKLDIKGTLRLSGSTSGYVGLAPAAAAGSTTYTLPVADGIGGHQLTTDGAGNLSWSPATPGTSALSGLTAATGTNTIDSTTFAQTWNWSGTTTQVPMTLTANALTTGSVLAVTSASNAVNSTNGLLYVANTGSSTSGTVARIAANASPGAGLTVLAAGNVGIGTATPATRLHVDGKATAGSVILTPVSGQPLPQIPSGGGGGSSQLTPSASAPATCDAGSDGQLGLTMEYRMCVCRNGSGWVFASDGYTACTWNQDNTPTAFAFTDLTGQALGALISSNTVTVTGIGPAAVAVSVSGTGSPELSIAGGAWVTSGTITNNQTLQLRLTSAPTSLTTRSATVTVGTATDQWDVATLNDPCSSSPSVGTVCADGSVYAGLSADGNVAMYVTRCDLGQTWSGSACTGTRSTPTWNDGTSNWLDTSLANCNDGGGTGAFTGDTTTCRTGKSNSAFLLTADSATTSGTNPHNAAKACEDLTLHGKSDWYLPSLRELWDLHPNRTAIGNLLTDGSWYWSSSEYDNSAAWIVRFSDGYRSSYGASKSNTYRVRCARR